MVKYSERVVLHTSNKTAMTKARRSGSKYYDGLSNGMFPTEQQQNKLMAIEGGRYY